MLWIMCSSMEKVEDLVRHLSLICDLLDLKTWKKVQRTVKHSKEMMMVK